MGRKFNGKVYHRSRWSKKKSVIKNRAKAWREGGYCARVIPGTNAKGDKGWYMYVGTPKKKRR